MAYQWLERDFLIFVIFLLQRIGVVLIHRVTGDEALRRGSPGPLRR
jgi:hypothetical protein